MLINVGAVGVEILAFPLTWHIAYTQQLVAIAQAVIWYNWQPCAQNKRNKISSRPKCRLYL